MSSTVKSKGFIAVLTTPIDPDALEEWSERLYDEKSPLDFTYDGNLVFSDMFRHMKLDAREDIYHLNIGTAIDDLTAFRSALKKYDLEIVDGTIQPYDCIWYNGSDCPVSELTPEQYRDII